MSLWSTYKTLEGENESLKEVVKMVRFPVYTDHRHVECFHCEKHIGTSDSEESGYGPKNGQYKVQCDKCGKWTFYDMKGA